MATQLATSFEEAWERFVALDSLQLAGDGAEPDWAHGRAQLLVFLIRIEDPAVRRHIGAVLEQLATIPGVEPLPEEYWHVTVKVAGFQVIKRSREDDVLREEVGALGKTAAGVLSQQSAYEARIGPPNGFQDVVCLEVQDGGRTRDLHRALAEGVPGVGSYPTDGDAFLPHVSIARFTSNEGIDQLKATLTELRSGDPGPTFQVTRVAYAKAWLIDDPPDFETLASLRLASP